VSTSRNPVRSLNEFQLPDAPVAEQPAETLRVLVVDADLKGKGPTQLRGALDRAGYEVLTAESAEAALALLDRVSDVHAAVIDDELPDRVSRGLVQMLMSRRPLCRSILVTSSTVQLSGPDLARSAAHIFLRKPKTVQELLDAISRTVRSTIDWRNALDPAARPSRGRRVSGEAPLPIHFELQRAVSRLRFIANLSPTETMVAWRLLWGDSNRRIGDLLGSSERTVKFHVAEVLARTGARSRAGLLRVLLEDSGIRDPWDERGGPATSGGVESAGDDE